MPASPSLSREDADAVLRRWLDRPVTCRGIRRLHGGMIREVFELEMVAQTFLSATWQAGMPAPPVAPGRAVVKVARGEADPFAREASELRYLRSHSRLPVPEVYACGRAGSVIAPAFLLMERLPGVNLGEADMTADDRRGLDVQLAEILLELHSHERETFGSLDGTESFAQWSDWFVPHIRENFSDARPRLSPRSLDLIPRLLDALPDRFESQGRPTLVHGDLWTTNIIVRKTWGQSPVSDDQNPGTVPMFSWRVTGFVDPASRYADVEYELAYLEVFGTVTAAFFERYRREHPAREGCDVRRLFYWLDTLMLHVWLFGDAPYVARTERIAVELSNRV